MPNLAKIIKPRKKKGKQKPLLSFGPPSEPNERLHHQRKLLLSKLKPPHVHPHFRHDQRPINAKLNSAESRQSAPSAKSEQKAQPWNQKPQRNSIYQKRDALLFTTKTSAVFFPCFFLAPPQISDVTIKKIQNKRRNKKQRKSANDSHFPKHSKGKKDAVFLDLTWRTQQHGNFRERGRRRRS